MKHRKSAAAKHAASTSLVEEPSKKRHVTHEKETNEKDDTFKETAYLIKEHELLTLFWQTYTLMWRNFNVFRRKTKIIMFMIMTPIAICFMLGYMANMIDSLKDVSMDTRSVEQIGKIQRCRNPLFLSRGDPGCATVGYSIIGDQAKEDAGEYQQVHDLMKVVSKNNDLEYGKDVKLLTVGKSTDFRDHILSNMNMTSYAILFCTDTWKETLEVQNFDKDMYNHSMTKEERQKKATSHIDFYMPCKFESHPERKTIFYSILYNISLQENAFFKAFSSPYWKDNNLLSLKNSIDNSILEMKAIEKGMDYIPSIELSYQAYPYVPDRMYLGADPIVNTGAFYLILVPLTVFMIIFEEMSREKAGNLRMGLLMIGCSNTAYWISWILTGVIFSMIMSTLMYVVGYAFQYTIFLQSPFYVIFLMIFSVSIAELAIAFFMLSVIHNQSTAYTISYVFILVSVINTMAIMDASVLYKLFYNLDMPEWSIYFRMVFELLPSFHFNKLFCDITRVTCFHMSFEGMLWVPGREWEVEDFFREVKGQFMTKDRYLIPSVYDSLVKLLQISLGYFLIALYFDNIYPENKGTSQPFYFFLKPSFWFKSCTRQALASPHQHVGRSRTSSFNSDSGNTHHHHHHSPHKTKNTAIEEKRSVKEAESESHENNGVRIIGLSKTYKGRSTWCKTGSEAKYMDVKALQSVYLEISEGELMGIMGHNGAGKTTLVNTLCGYVQLSGGNARLFDLQLNQDMENIRRRMGVVSQFDVLWDELTALDHMYLFSQMKRIGYTNELKFYNQRLREVGLVDSANLHVGKYSGGMRRRMSVALSTIGEPKVILMDEPTTGMDPVSRRQVWDLIQKMKKGRVIVMTTHAMEEAEMLSDKIAVLNHGEVSCVGTPLQLKNLLGKGYRVSLVCNRKQINLVKTLFKTVVPSSEFYETSGDSGSLVYNIPLDKVRELSNVFKLIDSKQVNPDDEGEQTVSINERKAMIKLRALVQDVGVSQTTLEEVFMAATTPSNEVPTAAATTPSSFLSDQ